jgi:hypothetical protein
MTTGIALFLFTGISIAQETQYGVPISRIKRMRRGFNASLIYFGKYDLNTYKDLKSKGYDHVRVTCRPGDVYDNGRAKQSGADRFKACASNAKAAGLGIMVAPHKNLDYPFRDYLTPKFVTFWADLAKKLSDTDPEYCFLELINEPGISNTDPSVPLLNADEWYDQQEQVARAIRANAPNHTIVLDGSQNMRDTSRLGGDLDVNWYQLDVLVRSYHTLPEGVDNCIISTRGYQPMAYTHQMGGPNWFTQIRNVSWPPTSANVQNAINHAEHPWAKQCLRDYLWYWETGGEQYEYEFKRVAQWRKQHDNIYVHVGEFGVYSKVGESLGREQYFRDIIGAMEKYNIGWNHWCQGYGPNRSWAGLDTELPEYDPTYTGLDETTVDYSIVHNIDHGKNTVGSPVYLQHNNSDLQDINIFDIAGRLHYSNISSCRFSNVSRGAYIIDLSNEKTISGIKMIHSGIR